ncbi:hypothetical protein HDU96_006368 [Phlyctochytrium bullatum]|nr:hypothetical protein HDU96_006368 [Phlyctochytrium bullatum]
MMVAELDTSFHPYKLLDLKTDYPVLTQSDVKRAYRRASLKHHPDKGGSPEMFRKIKAAHDSLTDPDRSPRRIKYYDCATNPTVIEFREKQASLGTGNGRDAAMYILFVLFVNFGWLGAVLLGMFTNVLLKCCEHLLLEFFQASFDPAMIAWLNCVPVSNNASGTHPPSAFVLPSTPPTLHPRHPDDLTDIEVIITIVFGPEICQCAYNVFHLLFTPGPGSLASLPATAFRPTRALPSPGWSPYGWVRRLVYEVALRVFVYLGGWLFVVREWCVDVKEGADAVMVVLRDDLGRR